MSRVKTYEGVIENGQIRVGADVDLPEKARVFVLVFEAPTESPIRMRSPRLADHGQAVDFAKEVVEIEDNARL